MPTRSAAPILRLASVLLTLLSAGGSPLLAQEERSLLDSAPLPPASRLLLRLHGGGYTIRSSKDERIHVTETRTGDVASLRSTDVRFHAVADGARLEIDPPNGKNSPQITVALPACAALDLRLTAGEVVLDLVPCEATTINVHAGELIVRLPDPDRYHALDASVSIGEIDAHGLGPASTDVEHGGFFPHFHRTGAGPRTFAARVGTGQITLEANKQ